MSYVHCNIFLSGTWNVPIWKRDAEQEYRDGHIAGAVRFDIAVVADREKKQPLMLPPPEQFAKQVGEVSLYYLTPLIFKYRTM